MAEVDSILLLEDTFLQRQNEPVIPQAFRDPYQVLYVFLLRMTEQQITIQNFRRWPTKTSCDINVAGVLRNPNGITLNWKWPSSKTLIAVSALDSSAIGICQYPLLKSSTL